MLLGQNSHRVGSDLVGDIAVRGHAIGTHDDAAHPPALNKSLASIVKLFVAASISIESLLEFETLNVSTTSNSAFGAVVPIPVTVKMDNVRVIRREGEEDAEIGEEYKKNNKSESGEENFGPEIGGL